jgi:predicted alpha/beta superfamily hydrolase
MNKCILLLLTIGSILLFHRKISAQPDDIQSQIKVLEVVDTIFSNTLGEDRAFWVKLPENYDPKSETKYPVIYLLDGFFLKNSLEAVYMNYWGHYLPHMILVGIDNSTNRTRDLTTSHIDMLHGGPIAFETGGAENFTQYIENELIPYIDKTYPSTPYRTLIGHSYGGLFTINMLVNHRHVFENYIAIDPSIEWDDQKLLIQAKERLKTENYQGKSLFVSLAAEQLHMQNEQVTMENIMEDTSEYTLFARSIIDFSTFAASHKDNGLNFSWKVYPEDLHGTVPLPSIRDGLIFLFEWYQFKSSQKYNNPGTSAEELKRLLKKQEQIYFTHFGYHFPPMIEEMLNAYGYMYLQMGQDEKAHMFFKLNIDYYPKSANAYDSMAEYYETKKEYSKALKYVMKAHELSPDEYYKKRIEALKRKQ